MANAQRLIDDIYGSEGPRRTIDHGKLWEAVADLKVGYERPSRASHALVVELLYGSELMTQADVARRLGVSPQLIWAKRRRALRMLRHPTRSSTWEVQS